MKKTEAILFIFILYAPLSMAQNFHFGAELGGNLTYVYTTSKYSYDKANGGNYPFLGYFGGGSISYQKAKYTLQTPIQYERRNVYKQINFFDQNGNPMGSDKVSQSTHYLTSGLIFLLRISEKFQVGPGIYFHYLLKSTTSITSLSSLNSPKSGLQKNKLNNYFLRKANFSFPIQFRLNFGKSYIFSTIDLGIISRIKDKRTPIKEHELCPQIGLGYKIR